MIEMLEIGYLLILQEFGKQECKTAQGIMVM